MVKALSILAVVALTATSAVASNEPNTAFNQFHAADQVAARVADVIGDTREVFVREFRGVGESHVGLALLIGESLSKNHKVDIRRGTAVEVEGRLKRFPLDDREPLEGYTINVTVTLPAGDRRFSLDVQNPEEARVKVVPPGEFIPPPSKPSGAVPDKTGPAVDKTGQNSPSGRETVARPAPGSPYGVEVLVEKGSEYVALPLTMDKGTISVRVRHGDIIALRLHNADPNFEAAASVLVDGLSRYALADDPERRGGLDLVSHQEPRIIKGYFRDGNEVDSFQIGEYSKSPAARLLPEASSAGTLTVSFQAAWEKGATPPPNEPNRTKSPPGVNQGPKRKDPTVTVERELGAVRAVVKIFYVTH